MTKSEDLIYEIQGNIANMYMLEDDAQYIRDNLDDWEKQEYESMDDAEQAAESYEQEAYQIYRIIESDLSELSEMLSQKVTLEDFTDGEFSS